MDIKRIVNWIGNVNADTTNKATRDILELQAKAPSEDIHLCICSGGGDLGMAFGFHDLILSLDLPLHTYAFGYLHSAAMVVFLSGKSRHVGQNITALIHPSARDMSKATLEDQKAFVREGEILQSNFERLVESKSKCGGEKFSQMKREVTVLDAQQLVDYGFAHSILPNAPA